MGNSGQIFVVKENLALSSQKLARVHGQQEKCGKDIVDFFKGNLLIVYVSKETLSMESCKEKLVDHLHEQ